MFPCEMARYIAGFLAEARKSGPLRWSSSRSDLGLRADRSRFSISEHSADISWPLPVPPDAAAGPDAAEAAADGRLEVPGAAAEPDAVAEVPGAAAVGPLEGVAAPVLLSAASDVAAAGVKPGVGVQRGRPAAQALQAPLRVSLAEKRPLVFAPFQAFSGHPRLRHRTPAPRPGWSQICFQG
jgi:hypothetical protein